MLVTLPKFQHGLVTSYDDIYLAPHSIRWCFAAWQQQGITQINIDLSSNMFFGIHLRAESQKSAYELRLNTSSEIKLWK